jgi:hypothetical protein
VALDFYTLFRFAEASEGKIRFLCGFAGISPTAKNQRRKIPLFFAMRPSENLR